ncbi:MAG: hypothetical protein WCX46_04420 [Candidatus Paceibacterota bacterium]|jgi:hypothetical protein
MEENNQIKLNNWSTVMVILLDIVTLIIFFYYQLFYSKLTWFFVFIIITFNFLWLVKIKNNCNKILMIFTTGIVFLFIGFYLLMGSFILMFNNGFW